MFSQRPRGSLAFDEKPSGPACWFRADRSRRGIGRFQVGGPLQLFAWSATLSIIRGTWYVNRLVPTRAWKNTWTKAMKKKKEKKVEGKRKVGQWTRRRVAVDDRFSLSFPEITGVCVVYLTEGTIVLGRIVERGNLVNVHTFVFQSG